MARYKKRLVGSIQLIIAMLICNSYSFGQLTVNASASANVITPIGLSKSVDMNFGNAAVSPTSGGLIVLDPAGTRTTYGSGVTLPGTTGTVSAAVFTVVGALGYTYSITLPTSAVISGPGTSSLTVSDFTSFPSVTGTLSSGGTQSLYVGATLTVAAAQAPGIYTNATAFPVMVNYN